jgi:hypothetical protein
LQSKNENDGKSPYINISRSHNQVHGNYDEPIIIEMHNTRFSVDEIGNALQKEFNTVVMFGKITWTRYPIEYFPIVEVIYHDSGVLKLSKYNF